MLFMSEIIIEDYLDVVGICVVVEYWFNKIFLSIVIKNL